MEVDIYKDFFAELGGLQTFPTIGGPPCDMRVSENGLQPTSKRNLRAMASNLLANGLQPTSDGLPT